MWEAFRPGAALAGAVAACGLGPPGFLARICGDPRRPEEVEANAAAALEALAAAGVPVVLDGRGHAWYPGWDDALLLVQLHAIHAALAPRHPTEALRRAAEGAADREALLCDASRLRAAPPGAARVRWVQPESHPAPPRALLRADLDQRSAAIAARWGGAAPPAPPPPRGAHAGRGRGAGAVAVVRDERVARG